MPRSGVAAFAAAAAVAAVKMGIPGAAYPVRWEKPQPQRDWEVSLRGVSMRASRAVVVPGVGRDVASLSRRRVFRFRAERDVVVVVLLLRWIAGDGVRKDDAPERRREASRNRSRNIIFMSVFYYLCYSNIFLLLTITIYITVASDVDKE